MCFVQNKKRPSETSIECMSRNKRKRKSSRDLSSIHHLLSNDEIARRLKLSYQTIQPQHLLTKREVAERLGLTLRGVECLLARRAIPVIRLSRRCVRFNWDRVKEALARHEVREVGR
jgi:excisionase family DNA binding protein